jgi:hypothetical protein
MDGHFWEIAESHPVIDTVTIIAVYRGDFKVFSRSQSINFRDAVLVDSEFDADSLEDFLAAFPLITQDLVENSVLHRTTVGIEEESSEPGIGVGTGAAEVAGGD